MIPLSVSNFGPMVSHSDWTTKQSPIYDTRGVFRIPETQSGLEYSERIVSLPTEVTNAYANRFAPCPCDVYGLEGPWYKVDFLAFDGHNLLLHTVGTTQELWEVVIDLLSV